MVHLVRHGKYSNKRRGVYLRAAFIPFFEQKCGVYSRAAFIQINTGSKARLSDQDLKEAQSIIADFEDFMDDSNIIHEKNESYAVGSINLVEKNSSHPNGFIAPKESKCMGKRKKLDPQFLLLNHFKNKTKFVYESLSNTEIGATTGNANINLEGVRRISLPENTGQTDITTTQQSFYNANSDVRKDVIDSNVKSKDSSDLREASTSKLSILNNSVSSLDALILRVYPLMFIEKAAHGRLIVRNEKEENLAAARFEQEVERITETILHDVQQRLEKENLSSGASKPAEIRIEIFTRYRISKSEIFKSEGYLGGAGAIPPLANVGVGVTILTGAQQKWPGC
uniref:Tower domain-containing protein n=1 Tax=Romanomermis culicivorax TaxID=13658 RepID=A0A915ICZ4_ROMCU